MMTELRAIAVLGLVAIPLNHAVLRRVRAIVETVAADPFVAANASRLQAIACAAALQLLSLVIGGIGKAISTPPTRFTSMPAFHQRLAGRNSDLRPRARLRRSTLMREDLEGTV